MSHLNPSLLLVQAVERCELVFDRLLFNKLVAKRYGISRESVIAARERLLVWRMDVEAGWDWSDASLHCQACIDCRVASQDLILEYNLKDPAKERKRPTRY